MKYRIKQKGNKQYTRYYPQKKGWKTIWSWENFIVSVFDIPVYVKNGLRDVDFGKYDSLFYDNFSDAEKYIEDYKAKHFEKQYKISDRREQRKLKLKNLKKN